MQNSDNNFEAKLTEHYQRTKREISAPSDIKRQVLNKARRVDKEPDSMSKLNGFVPIALAASILVLSFILFVPQLISPQNDAPENGIMVLHTLEVPSKSQSRALAYAHLEKEYAKRQIALTAIKKQAVLQINDNGSWDLEVCDEERIQISNQLVAMMDKYDVLPRSFQSGMSVAISFGVEGHIVQIDELEEPKSC